MRRQACRNVLRPGSPNPAARAPPQGQGQKPKPRVLREYRSRAERESEIQRYVVIGTIAVAAVAAVILIISVAVDQLVVPGQVVATVNGSNITVADFEQRVRLERALMNEELNQEIARLQAQGFDRDTIIQQISFVPPYSDYLTEMQISNDLGIRVLNDMIDDQVMRAQAAELGITVTDEDTQRQIQQQFGYDPSVFAADATQTPEPSSTPTPFVSPTPSNTPQPTPTAEFTATPSATPEPSQTPSPTPDATQRATTFTTESTSFLGNVRGSAGVGDAQINAYFETQALREALANEVLGLDAASRTGTFYNVRHILVGTQQEAQNLLDALNAGESFAALAAQNGTDGTAQQGGDLGWILPSGVVVEFAEAMRTAEVGALVGPVQTEFGYHVLQVLGTEQREMTEEEFQRERDAQLDEYIETLRDADETDVQIFDTWTDNVPAEPAFSARGL
ncbi:MAG: hypothetical protein HC828_21915 [Blastochloris sp.]|nr:hypothetical protein [Blastochloris sp.]